MRVSKYGTYKNGYLRALNASYPFSTPYEFLTDRQNNMCACISLSCKNFFLAVTARLRRENAKTKISFRKSKDANPGLIQLTYSFKPGLRLINQFE